MTERGRWLPVGREARVRRAGDGSGLSRDRRARCPRAQARSRSRGPRTGAGPACRCDARRRRPASGPRRRDAPRAETRRRRRARTGRCARRREHTRDRGVGQMKQAARREHVELGSRAGQRAERHQHPAPTREREQAKPEHGQPPLEERASLLRTGDRARDSVSRIGRMLDDGHTAANLPRIWNPFGLHVPPRRSARRAEP